MKRNATAVWSGTGKEGKGHLTTQSPVLREAKYSAPSRFEEAEGTNPEELIAAAHAGCFTMKLAFLLAAKGHTADRLETKCTITLESGTVTNSHLVLKAKVPGLTEGDFAPIAKEAKETCPISKLLKAEISLEYEFD